MDLRLLESKEAQFKACGHADDLQKTRRRLAIFSLLALSRASVLIACTRAVCRWRAAV